MEESKFRKAFREYRQENVRLVEWIIGLVISELALILSQHLYTKGTIFYFFLVFSFMSILLAVLIMYTIVSYIDIDLHSAFLAIQTRGKMKEKDFGVKFERRLGRATKWFISEVVERKAYKCLFYFFLLTTTMMIISIICNITIV